VEWSDLEIFLAAVRAGTYTAAGRELDINRTTVGRRIEGLEQALGVSLFENNPLGVAPTPQGARLLLAAERIESEINAMAAEIGAAARTPAPLRLVVSGGLGSEFLGEMAEFSRRYPGIPVQLLGELDPLDAVSQRRADLGIALVRALPLRLVGEKIGDVSQATYGRRGVKALAQLGWGYEFTAALPGAPWIPANPAGESAQSAGLSSVNSWPQMIGAVRAGLGTARLWCFAAESDQAIERLDEPSSRYDSPVWLVRRTKAPPSPALLQLMSFLRESVARRISASPVASASA